MIVFALPFLAIFAFLAWRSFPSALAVFFLLLPTYLIRFHIGPLPTTFLELMFFILFGVWMYHVLCIMQHPTDRRRYMLHVTCYIKKHPSLLIASTLFLLGATISIFTAVDVRAALGEWRAFYFEPVLMFAMIAGMNNEQLTINKRLSNSILEIRYGKLDIILFALILSGLVTSLFAIYQHFTGFFVPYSFWANRATYRVTAWYGYPNAVGLFLAPLLPLAVYTIQNTWKKIQTAQIKHSEPGLKENQLNIENCSLKIILICSLLFIPTSLLALMFAKGFGPIVAACVSAGLALMWHKKFRLGAIILALVCIAGLITFSLRSTPNEIALKNRSAHIRSDMWAETIEFLRTRPILGAGIASYSTRIAPYRIDTHIEIFSLPHNLLLSMWVNIGLIGLVGFVWIVVWFYRVGSMYLLAERRNNPSVALLPYILLSSMTAMIFMGAIDTPYIKNDLSMFFWLLIALMILCTEKTTKTTY